MKEHGLDFADLSPGMNTDDVQDLAFDDWRLWSSVAAASGERLVFPWA